jgi:hypothetical protein
MKQDSEACLEAGYRPPNAIDVGAINEKGGQ